MSSTLVRLSPTAEKTALTCLEDPGQAKLLLQGLGRLTGLQSSNTESAGQKKNKEVLSKCGEKR